MTEVVWVALISAGSAVVVALMTQFLTTRAADKQAARQEHREARQWQRSEATSLRDRHAAKLYELWSHALEAQSRVLNLVEQHSQGQGHKAHQEALDQASASFAARQVFAVALIELPALRAEAKSFVHSINRAQSSLSSEKFDHETLVATFKEVKQAFEQLEEAVAAEAERLKIAIA